MHEEPAEADAVDPKRGGPNPLALQQEPLVTVPLCESHKADVFACANSARISGFFKKEALVLVPGNYCRVFVAPNPDDTNEIWGFYSLSAALLVKENLSGSDEKRAVRNYYGYPAPMVRVGFMGRCDGSPKGLGVGLLIDAARRVHRNPDIAAWGLVLESEGGPENPKLWKWYQDQGFKPCRKTQPNSMYAALASLIPEFSSSQSN